MFECHISDWTNLLEKARSDNLWYYLLETKTGRQFIFSGVERVDDDWILLQPLNEAFQDVGEMLPFDGPKDRPYVVSERNVMMRLDAIAWVADGIS